jgi:hypothetical protein
MMKKKMSRVLTYCSGKTASASKGMGEKLRGRGAPGLIGGTLKGRECASEVDVLQN